MSDIFISTGTAVALVCLESSLKQIQPDVISIDIATLIRNVCNHNKGRLTVDDVTLEITDTLAKTIEILDNSGLPQCGIHFFIVDYHTAKRSYNLRDVPTSRKNVDDMVHQILRDRERMLRGVLNKRTLHGQHPLEVGACVGQDVLPWYKAQLNRFKIGAKTVVLSDSVVIWRAIHKLPLLILRSFTGEIVRLPELPHVVFGDAWADIPFISQTHDLLGDKKLVAPMIGIKEKRRLRDIAQAENWVRLPVAVVISKLKRNGCI